MEDSELTTTTDLVRRYAPDLIPQLNDTRLEWHVVVPICSLVAAMTVLGAMQLAGPIVLLVLGGCLVAGVPIAELVARRKHAAELSRFQRQLAESPWRYYDAVATKFAREIERQRSRTLGPNSDWGRARQPLEAAAQEAARLVAYWQQRCATDPDNEVATQQLETASRLRDKFQQALTELDARAQVLVTFFNECGARLAVLQSAKRDHEEVKKLGVLSERADDIVTDAQRTLAAIGSTFLTEAIRVANALGGLERAGLLNLAETVPVDRIEVLADRILESSLHERATLERLTREVVPKLAGFGEHLPNPA